MGKYVNFNEEAYKRDLQKAVGGVFDKVTKDVYLAMINNLSQLKVRKVDAEHVKTFPHALKATNKSTATRLVKHFGVDNSRPNKSFRALYYEYGTGANMRPPAKWNIGQGIDGWNEARPKQAGAPIYYRDRPWIDLGGNRHKGAVRKGVRKRIPRKSAYGQPVRSHFWFRRGIMTGTRNLDPLILQAVKSVPITAYIKLRDIRARM